MYGEQNKKYVSYISVEIFKKGCSKLFIPGANQINRFEHEKGL